PSTQLRRGQLRGSVTAPDGALDRGRQSRRGPVSREEQAARAGPRGRSQWLERGSGADRGPALLVDARSQELRLARRWKRLGQLARGLLENRFAGTLLVSERGAPHGADLVSAVL